jgi:protoporphyrin/coproporphyrin ferrochelatase
MKRGVLLLNFGGPRTPQEVKPFLYELFADPSILVGIPTPFRQMLAWIIAQAKSDSSIKAYEAIGGGSPQLQWTKAQADGLGVLLGDEAKIAIGMRASSPRIEEGLKELQSWGAEELVLLPLFPQYSTTTTGCCLREVRRLLLKWRWNPRVYEITRWPDHVSYIRLLRQILDEAIKKAQAEAVGEEIHVLLSAHSLPIKIVKRGDPYPGDIQKTVQALTKGLLTPWSLAFQSRNGSLPWLEPYTEHEIIRLGTAGIKNLVVVPISFVSDHIETLWELDLIYAKLARKSGIQRYYRARSFNGDPLFTEVLRALIIDRGLGERT